MLRFFTILLLSASINIFAQVPNPKAKEFYEKALKNISERKQVDAIENLQKAIEKDSTFADPYFKLGQINEAARNQENATKFYKKAIELRPDDPLLTQAYTYIGTRLLKVGDYALAKDYLSFSIKNVPQNSPVMKQLTRQKEQCNFGEAAKKNPLTIIAKEMSPVINFKENQYFPVLTADNETLIFTAFSKGGDENLYASQLIKGNWSAPKSISDKINTSSNEGTCSISADGRILVFTSCDGKNSLGSCDLYISKKVGEDWSVPENLGSGVNTSFWEAQPSLSNDGRVLYFSSDRQGGYGRKDLWVSELIDNKTWSKAINMGGIINSTNDEISPFIHANGHTLFFASDGHLGMGGLDLFMTESNIGVYSKPENLGFPINTHQDQVALFISADGSKGYYSSDVKPDIKIFQIDIPTKLSNKFKRASFVKGIVQDASNNKSISAEIELIDLKTNKVVEKTISDAITGQYTAVLPNGSQYGLFINKKEYFFKSLTFNFSEKIEADGKTINILLNPIKKDVKTVLNNIFFDTGKAELRPESFIELDKLQLLFVQNPSLQVEISGHTDDIGKDIENQILSEKRALSVANYLITKGINNQNIKVKGYGKTKPIMPNISEEKRQINRRIEISIL
jgi:outer membrane protein OmpA-like peptidoglycan-associated protein/tetratricopeptide (TPR) repeat protein